MCFYEGHTTNCSIILRALGIKGQYISMTSVNTLRVYNTEIQKKKKKDCHMIISLFQVY